MIDTIGCSCYLIDLFFSCQISQVNQIMNNLFSLSNHSVSASITHSLVLIYGVKDATDLTGKKQINQIMNNLFSLSNHSVAAAITHSLVLIYGVKDATDLTGKKQINQI